METKICAFEDNPITFALEKNNGMMINATEMAKPFGKNVGHFLENESTKKFIEVCINNRNSDYLRLNSPSDLIDARQKSGTWMHRILALKFAAWLSPEFEVWVYATIERLLFGKHVQREQSFERTLSLQKELDDLKDKPRKSGEDFERFLEISRLLKHERSVRRSLTTETVSGMRSLFKDDEEE